MSRRDFIASGAALSGASALAASGLGAGEGVSEERIDVGLIGVGGRGTRHLTELLAIPAARVVSVCDIDEGRASRAAERVAAAGDTRPAIFTDHRKLLERGGLDAVFSATPCDQHHRIYMDCIAAGVHLYAEKPLGMTAGECDAIVKAAEASKHKVQVGFQRRANPRMIECVKLLREDRVFGPLLEGRAAYNNAWGPPWGLGEPGDWKSLRARSGDWAIEQAVHAWDVLNWVFGGTPLRAFGLGTPRVFAKGDPKRDVTDLYAAMLEYPGTPHNIVVQFSHSWASPPDRAFSGTYVRVVGLEGGVDLTDCELIYSSRSTLAGKRRPVGAKGPNETALAVRSFVDAVKRDLKPVATVRDGRDATLVGLLVRKAVDERRVVEWSEIA